MRIKSLVLTIFLSGAVASSLGACGSDSSNPPSCNNNGMVDNGEQCDGLDLHGQTCMTVTLNMSASGTLACKMDCTFDTSHCTTGAGGASGTGGGSNGTGGGH
jgi:hypothetical protein